MNKKGTVMYKNLTPNTTYEHSFGQGHPSNEKSFEFQHTLLVRLLGKFKNVLGKTDVGSECSCILSIALLCYPWVLNSGWASGNYN